MKKLIILLLAAGSILPAGAQTTTTTTPAYSKDKDLSRWVLDLNFLGGGYTQHMDVANTTANYLNGINVNTGKVGFKNGSALGGDAQIGFFFGKNRHWGIGTGFLYMREMGDVTLGNFHTEYQATDNNGYTFRQVVTGNNVDDRIKTDNFNIPLVLKYKYRFSKHWGFTADGGALFNFKMKNTYNTKSTFDYEAIYKFVTDGAGGTTPVYETATTPATTDFLITKAQFANNNPEGNVQDYFNTKRTQGYDVGLGVAPNSKTGVVSYNTWSVGFLIQPSVNYFFSDHVALNLGVYYLYQPFSNNAAPGYTVTNKFGDYSSVMNSATHVQTQSYGGNIGLRFFLGKKAEPLKITGIDPYAPTICGLCNGSVTLHGLPAGKEVSVNYSVDGTATAAPYTGFVATDGTVKVQGLCAGSYTDITAKVGRKTATGMPVALVAVPLTITGQQSTNPSAPGACDATIKLFGLSAGQNVTVSYSINGTPHTPYATTVAADNSITIPGLCEGTYTPITVTSNKCTATLTSPASIVLTAPAPPPPAPVAPAAQTEVAETIRPILFDFNKSTIHHSSYPELDRLAREMKADKDINLTIEGNTDAIGTDAYNQKLSVRRAAAVKAALKSRGINPNRIKIKGDGERDPVATNKTTEGRKENRNAEIQIKFIDKK